MSERSQRIKEELRVKIRPLMTPEIIEAVSVGRDLPDDQITLLVSLQLKVTPPWSGVTSSLAGQIMREEADKAAPPTA
jgi:hypothetical protein